MFIERVPPIQLDNEDSINRISDYFHGKEADPRLTPIVYRLLGMIFRPRIAFDLGTQEQIREHFDIDGQLVVAMKHVKAIDPTVMAGAVSRKTLIPLREGADIMAKPVLFENPALGLLISNLGAYIGFRTQDFKNPKFGAPNDELEVKGLRDLARKRTIANGVARLNLGRHQGIFFEGTRSGQDLVTKDSVKSGIVEMIRQVDNPDNIGIVCAAINYERGIFRPIVAFSQLIQPPHNPDQLPELIAEQTQQCVNVAGWMANKPRPYKI
ncbi:MAG TPA: 1-acyl-sn-glycerol-3-phosphate acyltransferase [Candidatus Saccharimonadales bacterium]|nr:1-acyl-sn-glycerol-3-phosphate acyltransferase [Candidatus Saccharimonadales bacterium]